MKTVKYPPAEVWRKLAERPVSRDESLSARVRAIVETVKRDGDTAVQAFGAQFDAAALDDPSLPRRERDRLAEKAQPELKAAIDRAFENIAGFHRSQLHVEREIQTSPGIVCFRRAVAIERVGLYIPGGTAPLFSTLLMLGIPAQIAGCKEIVLSTPPDESGEIHPALAYIAQRLDVDEIYRIGGAHAIAALAYGTGRIRAVSKICGPGNRFVTEAKMQVAAAGIAIDLPAGPSEVLVIGDHGANPNFVAADLLAQAEHGPDSQVVLVTDDATLVESVLAEVEAQMKRLPRGTIAEEAVNGSLAVIVSSIGEAIQFSNCYAPEHLILHVDDPDRYVPLIENAGSVFLGALSAESFGDYASGTNHVLPINGHARGYSGVSTDTFIKKITFQRVDERGLVDLGDAVIALARAEGLEAHAQAIIVRQGLTKGGSL